MSDKQRDDDLIARGRELARDEVELLPCPFCPDGGKPYFTKAVNGTNMAYVGCGQCGVQLKAQVQFLSSREDWRLSKDIVGIWNHRATASTPVSTIPEYKYECSDCGWQGNTEYCLRCASSLTVPAEERFIRNVQVTDAEKIPRKDFRIDQLDPDWTVMKMTADFVYVARRPTPTTQADRPRQIFDAGFSGKGE